MAVADAASVSCFMNFRNYSQYDIKEEVEEEEEEREEYEEEENEDTVVMVEESYWPSAVAVVEQKEVNTLLGGKKNKDLEKEMEEDNETRKEDEEKEEDAEEVEKDEVWELVVEKEKDEDVEMGKLEKRASYRYLNYSHDVDENMMTVLENALSALNLTAHDLNLNHSTASPAKHDVMRLTTNVMTPKTDDCVTLTCHVMIPKSGVTKLMPDIVTLKVDAMTPTLDAMSLTPEIMAPQYKKPKPDIIKPKPRIGPKPGIGPKPSIMAPKSIVMTKKPGVMKLTPEVKTQKSDVTTPTSDFTNVKLNLLQESLGSISLIRIGALKTDVKQTSATTTDVDDMAFERLLELDHFDTSGNSDRSNRIDPNSRGVASSVDQIVVASETYSVQNDSNTAKSLPICLLPHFSPLPTEAEIAVDCDQTTFLTPTTNKTSSVSSLGDVLRNGKDTIEENVMDSSIENVLLPAIYNVNDTAMTNSPTNDIVKAAKLDEEQNDVKLTECAENTVRKLYISQTSTTATDSQTCASDLSPATFATDAANSFKSMNSLKSLAAIEQLKAELRLNNHGPDSAKSESDPVPTGNGQSPLDWLFGVPNIVRAVGIKSSKLSELNLADSTLENSREDSSFSNWEPMRVAHRQRPPDERVLERHDRQKEERKSPDMTSQAVLLRSDGRVSARLTGQQLMAQLKRLQFAGHLSGPPVLERIAAKSTRQLPGSQSIEYLAQSQQPWYLSGWHPFEHVRQSQLTGSLSGSRSPAPLLKGKLHCTAGPGGLGLQEERDCNSKSQFFNSENLKDPAIGDGTKTISISEQIDLARSCSPAHIAPEALQHTGPISETFTSPVADVLCTSQNRSIGDLHVRYDGLSRHVGSVVPPQVGSETNRSGLGYDSKSGHQQGSASGVRLLSAYREPVVVNETEKCLASAEVDKSAPHFKTQTKAGNGSNTVTSTVSGTSHSTATSSANISASSSNVMSSLYVTSPSSLIMTSSTLLTSTESFGVVSGSVTSEKVSPSSNQSTVNSNEFRKFNAHRRSQMSSSSGPCSSLSSSSTTESATEELQAHEIKKLKLQLDLANEKIAALCTQIRLCALFQETTELMSNKCNKLGSLLQEKDSELCALRRASVSKPGDFHRPQLQSLTCASSLDGRPNFSSSSFVPRHTSRSSTPPHLEVSGENRPAFIRHMSCESLTSLNSGSSCGSTVSRQSTDSTAIAVGKRSGKIPPQLSDRKKKRKNWIKDSLVRVFAGQKLGRTESTSLDEPDTVSVNSVFTGVHYPSATVQSRDKMCSSSDSPANYSYEVEEELRQTRLSCTELRLQELASFERVQQLEEQINSLQGTVASLSLDNKRLRTLLLRHRNNNNNPKQDHPRDCSQDYCNITSATEADQSEMNETLTNADTLSE